MQYRCQQCRLSDFTSVDHFGRLQQHRLRDGEAKRFGRFQVDGEFELRRLLYWKFGDVFTPQDLIDVRCGASEQVHNVNPI